MNVVVDASVALKWLIAEEDSETALLVRADHDIAAPDLLFIECRNALLSKVRRRELQRTEAEEAQGALEEIGSGITVLPSLPILRQAFVIALDLAEPIYDCIYLAAALATDRKLITADVRFASKVAHLRFAQNQIALLHLLPS
jgi:predicted nucleic acid-binding protein